MGPTLPAFPDEESIVHITFELVDPEPAFLRFEIGLVAYQNLDGDYVGADGAIVPEPLWIVGDDLFDDTQETDLLQEDAPALDAPNVDEPNASEDAAETGSLEDTQETDAEFELDDRDAGETDNIDMPELEVEPLDVNEPLMPADDDVPEVEVVPMNGPVVPTQPGPTHEQIPPSLDDLELGRDNDENTAPPSLDEPDDGSVALPELEVEPLDDDSDDDDDHDFMLPPDSEVEEVEPTAPVTDDSMTEATTKARQGPRFESVPLEQVVGSSRDGRFISKHADEKLHIEAIYEDGALTSFSKINVKDRPEFRRTSSDGRDMLVVYGSEGTLSYIRTPTTRRVQVQNDGLVKWDQSTEFNPDMTAEGFQESFKVYDKLHRHFAYHRADTPWRLDAFGFEPYSAIVDQFDQFFDATVFAENREGDWLVMIDEPGPHQGKIFINYHQDGLYHLDVLDEFILDEVDPKLVDDRNLLIEDMPFFQENAILGGYARFFAELNLRPVPDLLRDLRHVPALDLADLM
jgi:hypothetical protein